MMLVGIALVKMDVLTGQRSFAFYGWMAAICLGIGLGSGFALMWIILKGGFAAKRLGSVSLSMSPAGWPGWVTARSCLCS